MSQADRRRHVYAIGSSGCGKTNLLLRLIEADIEDNHALCVVDLRGDLVDRILVRLAATYSPATIARRLVLIDLRESDYIVPFNPLAGDGDAYNRAFHVLEVLCKQADSWGVQLDETLRNSLLVLAEVNESLLMIEPLLSNKQYRATLLARVKDSRVRAFFDRYEKMSEDKKSAWYLPVFNKVTSLLAMPQTRLILGQSDTIPLGTLMDKQPGVIVLVALAVDRLHQAATMMGGLFVSAFQNAIMARVDQPEHLRVPVHLYVDEFETMATDRFEAILAEGRRFGLGLCLSHQNLSQLPKGLRDVTLNNVSNRLFFQTGAGDAAELAREIVSPVPREKLRDCLISQGTGQAFLVVKGAPPRHLQCALTPDPRPSAGAIRAIREASLRNYGRPRIDVEREIATRDASIAALVPSSPSATSSSITAPPVGRSTMPLSGPWAEREREAPAGIPRAGKRRPKAVSDAATYEIVHDVQAGQYAPKQEKHAKRTTTEKEKEPTKGSKRRRDAETQLSSSGEQEQDVTE